MNGAAVSSPGLSKEAAATIRFNQEMKSAFECCDSADGRRISPRSRFGDGMGRGNTFDQRRRRCSPPCSVALNAYLVMLLELRAFIVILVVNIFEFRNVTVDNSLPHNNVSPNCLLPHSSQNFRPRQSSKAHRRHIAFLILNDARC
jgi:hypothetical protein